MRTIPNRSADSRSRTWTRPLRSLTVVLAVLTALLAPSPQPAGAAEATDGPTAAAWAADWLDRHFDDGLPLENFGSPDWGTTIEAALALAALGGNDARLDQVWAAVETDREDIVTSSGADVPGRLALVILLAHALGEDPTAVGAGGGADLVARLQATLTVGGADDGLFGSQDPTYDGAYRQGYSLAALVAAGVTPAPAAVSWLEDQQCADGSWMPYRADTSQPCAFDGGLFVGPDSNSTAAAISGLDAAGQGAGAAVTAALGWLDAVQHDDGGWSFFPTDDADPNSTAVVIMALRAVGALDDARFADRDAAPLAALLSFQLACAEGEDAGAFTFPGSNGAPNLFATAQAASAAAGATLGITGPVAPGPFADPCAVPPTTTTVAGPDGGRGPGQGSVVDDGARPAALAFTGRTSIAPVVAGIALLLAGAVALGAARRRTS